MNSNPGNPFKAIGNWNHALHGSLDHLETQSFSFHVYELVQPVRSLRTEALEPKIIHSPLLLFLFLLFININIKKIFNSFSKQSLFFFHYSFLSIKK